MLNKFGLLLDFLGFLMLFWQSAINPNRKIEKGGGSPTTPSDEIFQMERALKWIPSKSLIIFFAKHWQMVAFGLISSGVFFQLVSCS